MRTDSLFQKGTQGNFKKDTLAEEVAPDTNVLTVIPKGTPVEILGILPLRVRVVLPGDKHITEFLLNEPRRLGELIDVTYNPETGSIL